MQTFCKVGNSYINKDIIDNISSMRVVVSETKIVLSEEEKKTTMPLGSWMNFQKIRLIY